MLHIVNQSPFSSDALQSCLKHALPDSAILLIEDGVLAASNHTDFKTLTVYALIPDLAARGLSDKINPTITAIDYDGFVALAEKHSPIQHWF